MDAWWNDIAEAYSKLSNPKAIREAGLHILTVRDLAYTLNTVIEGKTATTIVPEIAAWCEKRPELKVIQQDGIWRIRKRRKKDDVGNDVDGLQR